MPGASYGSIWIDLQVSRSNEHRWAICHVSEDVRGDDGEGDVHVYTCDHGVTCGNCLTLSSFDAV